MIAIEHQLNIKAARGCTWPNLRLEECQRSCPYLVREHVPRSSLNIRCQISVASSAANASAMMFTPSRIYSIGLPGRPEFAQVGRMSSPFSAEMIETRCRQARQSRGEEGGGNFQPRREGCHAQAGDNQESNCANNAAVAADLWKRTMACSSCRRRT